MMAKHSRRRSLRRVLVAPLISVVVAACGIASQIEGGHAESESASLHVQAASTPTGSAQQWKLAWEDDFAGNGLPRNWTSLISGNGFSDHSLAWFGNTNATLTGHGG